MVLDFVQLGLCGFRPKGVNRLSAISAIFYHGDILLSLIVCLSISGGSLGLKGNFTKINKHILILADQSPKIFPVYYLVFNTNQYNGITNLQSEYNQGGFNFDR